MAQHSRRESRLGQRFWGSEERSAEHSATGDRHVRWGCNEHGGTGIRKVYNGILTKSNHFIRHFEFFCYYCPKTTKNILEKIHRIKNSAYHFQLLKLPMLAIVSSKSCHNMANKSTTICKGSPPLKTLISHLQRPKPPFHVKARNPFMEPSAPLSTDFFLKLPQQRWNS